MSISILVIIFGIIFFQNVFSEDTPLPGNQFGMWQDSSACQTPMQCSRRNRCSEIPRGSQRVRCGSNRRMICCLTRPDAEKKPETTPSPECGMPSKKYSPSLLMVDGRVQQGEFPWMVTIMMRDKNGSEKTWCAGFLIDNRHVLTSAHCVLNKNTDLYSTRVGDIDYANGTRYDVASIDIPTGYHRKYFHNDIAMLTLDKEVQFPGFNPVCLPDEEIAKKNLTGYGTMLVSWGLKRRDEKLSPARKRVFYLPVISNTRCNELFQKKVPSFPLYFPKGITDDILCTKVDEPSIDSCTEDSGDPLLLRQKDRWVAVGIAAFGGDCARPELPSGYTRISFFMDWIRRKMRT